MKRVAIVAIAVAGVGLFGTGVRGLAALDERLADETPAATHEVKRKLAPRDDCPFPGNRSVSERRQL